MPWSLGCVVGGGFDFQHGCAYPQAVKSIQECGSSSSAEACLTERFSDRVTSYTRDLKSTSDFSKLIDTTTKAEGGGWGVKVSTSVNVLTSEVITASSVAFVLGASGEVKQTSISDPVGLRLTRAAAELLERDPAGFLARHSPHYVYAVVHGGSFLGTVAVESKTTANPSSIDFALDLSVSFGVFTAEGSAEFIHKVEDNKEDVRMSLRADWLGGTGVFAEPESTPASLARTYTAWADTWRTHPHELKIVLRRWVDIQEVQQILNKHNASVQRLFYADTLKPTILAMLAKESALLHLLQNSLTRAQAWKELKANRTLKDEFDALQLDAWQHSLVLEKLDFLGVMSLQNKVVLGDLSQFVAEKLIQRYEDLKAASGRRCDDGSYFVDGGCVPWGGKCANGHLPPVAERTFDDQCGSCLPGHVLIDNQCLGFELQEEHKSEEWDHGANTRVLTEKVDGYVCALQEVAVEDLYYSGTWSAAWCKVSPEDKRWRMHTEASGQWTDVGCGTRCIASTYLASGPFYVVRNADRRWDASGVSKKALVSTAGSVCWLSMVSFWQASMPHEWAECAIKRDETSKVWELQASVKQTHSRTGAECGAVCLHDLPVEAFEVDDEVVRHWDQSGCTETDLGSADDRHCFLSSMAVSHARYNSERPRCSLVVDYEPRKWTLLTCNGRAREAETMCGVRCIRFATKVSQEPPFENEIASRGDNALESEWLIDRESLPSVQS